MNFNAIIDTSAFIWDKEAFENGQTNYYQLAADIVSFVEAFEKEEPNIYLRSNLLSEMINEFPWDLVTNNSFFYEFKNIVFAFLMRLPENIIEFEGNILDNLISQPNIIYNYYSDTVKEEIGFIISEMHSNNTPEFVYFTFKPIWTGNNILNTVYQKTTIPHKAVVHPENDLATFFQRYKPTFEHNPKHDHLRGADKERGYRIQNGEEVNQLSCYDSRNNTGIPQQLLAIAKPEKGDRSKLYSYDDVNHTYVCFVPHELDKNKYHGFDEKMSKIPYSIKQKFGKY